MNHGSQMLSKELAYGQSKATSQKGQLRIYLGYAPAVGKSEAMMSDAMDEKNSGSDVVIGWLDSYDESIQSAYQDQFEWIPSLSKTGNHGETRAFDVLAVSKRRPDLVILDNMADDNQSISLHDKRYQDIEYLLAEGISVYTTLNIESVQSLKKTVELILESSSKDSVPDRLFDRADQIELVDIDPSALLKRYDQMIRSKIIKSRQIDRYMNQNKLIALREIALRKAADQVFHQATYVNEDDTTKKLQEHILACISSSPTNAHVIRSAARMAKAFNADFTALYVGQKENGQLSTDGNHFRDTWL